MNISFSKFTLTSSRQLNAKEGIGSYEGVFLMGERQGKKSFWEYFPHSSLGDKDVDTFLTDFSSAKTEAQKKAHLRLSRPLEDISDKTFLNHELFVKGSTPKSKILKYKIEHTSDLMFLELIKKGHVIRLDANGIFDIENWKDLENQIPENCLDKIEYVEDPMAMTDWGSVHLRRARDFIPGLEYEVKVYKPIRELFPLEAKQVIFSSSMGNLLGQYSTYLELMHFGDLSLHHGLVTPGIYREVPELFEGDYQSGFRVNKSIVDKCMNDLHEKKWTTLCTI